MLEQATATLTRLKPVWIDKSISLSFKISLMCSLVTSIFLYACESWTLTAELQRRYTSHGNEVLPQDTTHLIQRPCYQRGRPCQDPAGKWTTRRIPDDRKETQTAVVWSCFPFIRSGQNHLARHSERAKKTRRTKEEVERQHQGMDRPGVRQVPEGSGEQGKMERTGCKNICGALTILAVKGLMMMMMVPMMMITIMMMTIMTVMNDCISVLAQVAIGKRLMTTRRFN